MRYVQTSAFTNQKERTMIVKMAEGNLKTKFGE
ncbi:hypothetical protein SAMN05216167_106238 [Spirosoma endophyticum]|uniref:Uncharacterized protein n=1 Tax=Spirosoma endophyticum TaxID=662367 RepID=A0A1I1UM90_9BACT|nr:hypothetical protein SAMN05216167_106238 [Spirosoma endophyticum]